ncbi:MAG TPA: FtsQ-type POTRA domain-containing protein [Syntrophales bacterium]|nr:FtsQ-type POTRA domain-containing protein [Syntrophales bacterium]HPC00478.1 FtsQ-type POTRA domain-containing protein [Syntrophales bacterium]HPQ05561.1 FtsQ-type POTRA domain-containing protein [Syntrophales bacterium]HRS86033.1 FtsQ-type POTRA domain-containing protein [Syntrophales bacterium]
MRRLFPIRRKRPYAVPPARYRLRRNSGALARDAAFALLSLLAVAGAASLWIYCYAHLMSLPFLTVREVVARGCQELQERDVLALAGVPRGVNLLAVDLTETAARVKRNPWVREAYVGREYPDRLVVEIRERRPVALFKRGEELYLLDEEGTAFKRLEGRDNRDLPVLTGLAGEGPEREALMKKTLSLLGVLSRQGTFPDIASVSEIHADPRQGFLIFTNRGYGLQVGLDDFEVKLRELPTVLADLTRRNLRTGFLLIDLSEPGKITVQRRDITTPPAGSDERARYKT